MKFAIIGVSLFCLNILFGLIIGWFLLKKVAPQLPFPAYQDRVATFKKRLPLIFLNISLLILLTVISLIYARSYFSLTFPFGITIALIQFFLFVVIDDLWFYGFHRYLHKNKFLFKKIHRIHHQANKPLPLEFIYTHPLEWMIGALGIVLTCIVIRLLFGEINGYIFLAYSFFRGFHDVLLHSNTKSVVLNHIPFFLPNEAHALHHSRPTGNYASMLNYLDVFFKTKIQ